MGSRRSYYCRLGRRIDPVLDNDIFNDLLIPVLGLDFLSKPPKGFMQLDFQYSVNSIGYKDDP
jgi:hypothetical protein